MHHNTKLEPDIGQVWQSLTTNTTCTISSILLRENTGCAVDKYTGRQTMFWDRKTGPKPWNWTLIKNRCYDCLCLENSEILLNVFYWDELSRSYRKDI